MNSSQRLLSEYGYQRVPAHILKECECQDCRGEFRNKILWTQETLREPQSQESYSRWVERIRMNSYCRDHAIRRCQ